MTRPNGAAFLDQACGGDPRPAARVEVCSAITAEPAQLPGGARPAPCRRRRSTSRPRLNGPGTVIGPYKLLEQIGEGGFGVVFMAEQQQPVRRKVALKIIKPGMDTRQVIARFEAERQALALMDHPNIAKVLRRRRRPNRAGPTSSWSWSRASRSPTTATRTSSTPRERLELFVHGLPGRAARPSKGDHPPRPQAVERAGHAARRHAGGQGDRLRHRQGDGPAADREDALHRLRPDDRHAALHEPRAGGDERPGHRHAQRHLLAGRAALRAADRHDAVRQGAPAARPATTRFAGSSARRSRRSRARG